MVEVLTIRTELSEVRTGRPRADLLLARSRACLVNKTIYLLHAKILEEEVEDSRNGLRKNVILMDPDHALFFVR